MRNPSLRNKSISSAVLLATALLASEIPMTASATTTGPGAAATKQVSPELSATMNGIKSLKIDADANRIAAHPIAATLENPAPVTIALGRYCSDPWYELSGIQLITCLLK